MGGAFTGLNGLRNSTSSTEGLENEINEGECILAVQASGEFMRTVPVVGQQGIPKTHLSPNLHSACLKIALVLAAFLFCETCNLA
eukprot:6473328-Amphidinium_carterae.1